MRSFSLYYGAPVSANAYPQYSTLELEKTLESRYLDGETRGLIEQEISRRAALPPRKRAALRRNPR